MSNKIRIFVDKITIENWKSIKKLQLDLQPGVNLLVGANASGKSNILEAIYFLYKSLVEAPSRIPYIPHIPEYWSGLDLIYMKDPSREVKLGLSINIYVKNGEKWDLQNLKINVTYKYDNTRDTLVPTLYEYIINKDTIIRYEGRVLRVEVVGELAKYLLEKDLLFMYKCLEYENLKPVEYKTVIDNNNVKLIAEIDNYLFDMASVRLPKPSLQIIRCKNVKNENDEIVFMSIDIMKHVLSKRLPFAPVWYRVDRVAEPKGIDVRKIIKYIQYIKLDRSVSIFTIVLQNLNDILSRILYLKHPDIGSLNEPKRFEGNLRLDPRARNLPEVILALMGRKGKLEILEESISRAFPNYSLRVESSHGRVFLIAEENGLELPPSNMPDGLVKLAALAVVMELDPVVLLIDELENSMHASLLEQVYDMLDSLPVPVLVATHSPVLIDLAGPEKIVVVKRGPDGTVVERVSDPRRLMQVLEEEGVTLSDHVIYSMTRD